MPVVHEDVDLQAFRELDDTQKDEMSTFYVETVEGYPLAERVWTKAMDAGFMYEPRHSMKGTHVDIHGEAIPQMGVVGLIITATVMPYYIIRESIIEYWKTDRILREASNSMLSRL